MKPFHEALQAFLAQGIVVEEALLPMHYASLDRLDDWQAGFRTHGLTGESLVGDRDGDWQRHWYVIALSGLDDPFFIAADEAGCGYPVYTAAHGAGRWDALQVAPSLEAFARLLQTLAEVTDDDEAFERVVVTQADPANPFWREVLQTRAEQAEDEDERSIRSVPGDPADFDRGDLIVTALGPHKLKVVQVVSKCRGLSLKAALAHVETPGFQVACGTRLQLRRLGEALEALGATTVFRLEQ